MRWAVIGDYGTASAAAGRVASLVSRWAPDFVITTGDNMYNMHSFDYHMSTGQFYCDFLAGALQSGSCATSQQRVSGANAFFPTAGNHDYEFNISAYLSYFQLPGCERAIPFCMLVWL